MEQTTINWLSNSPWTNTGYGNQTRTFLPRLKALGYNMICTAFYGLEGGILNWDGIPVYPKGRETYGNDIAAAHTRHAVGNDIDPCLLISLIDAWVMKPELLQLHGVKWVPWFPVDMEPLPPPVARSIQRAFRRIVFTRFGEKMVNDAGMDAYYVPHGINTEVYAPMPESKNEIREKIGLPKDVFLVGTVAANKGTPSRKSFPEMFAAFAELKKAHDDVVLYVHSTRGEHGENQGLNLPELADTFNLVVGQDVIFPDQYNLLIGYDDHFVAALYNAFDVFLLPSMGEGFGIPIVEAQACGTPVIVGDWTAMSELCLSGWKIPKKDATPFYTPLAAYQYIARVGAITRCLKEAYHATGDMMSKRAAKKAKYYDADRVTEKYWKPVLAEITEAVAQWAS